MKKISLIILLILPFFVQSQIQDNSLPFAFGRKNILKSAKTYEIKDFNANELLIQDNQKALIKPFAFAKGFNSNISFNDAYTIKNGRFEIKYLKITAKDALGLSVTFNNFKLQKDEKIYIFDSEMNYLIGAITDQNNKDNGILPTRFLPTDTIIIEYQKLADNNSDIIIATVGAAFRPLNDDSEYCEVNINCEESELWQTIKRSVARITFQDDDDNSYYVCTGTLIANTKYDNTPYFLTANHCINTQTEAQSAVFNFNFESTLCSGSLGDETQAISGATLLATADYDVDFSLLQLSVTPPSAYNPYYAGWSRIEEYSDTSVCIHHPGGNIKKISKDYDALEVSSFTGYDFLKHWNILEWDEGTTEGGSSGSGLFTTEGLLIGTLSGGAASCDYNYDDLFQQFYHEWDDYNSYNKQLKHWLDPYSFSPEKMYGYDPYENGILNEPYNFTAVLNENIVTIDWTAPTPSPDKYIIYRNLEPIYETNSVQTYTDELTNDGVYVYFATAIYSNKESKPSNMVNLVYGDTTTVPKVTDIQLFPNPASSQITIYTPDSIPLTKVEIIDLNGKVVQTEEFDESLKATIQVSTLSEAVYIVRLFTTGETYIQKLVIKPE